MLTILLLFFAERELDFADTIFQKAFYEGAITHYQKFIFYNFSSPSLSYARYQLALSYLKRDKDGDQLKGKRILWELAHDFGEMADSGINRKARLTLISLLLKEKRMEEVKELSLTFGDTSLFGRIKEIRLPKKEWLASLFSAFIPGLGEVYSGRYSEGLKAFSVNALSLYTIYHSLKREKKMDASLIFSFIFLRFYLGSIQNAFRFARENNENYLARELQRKGVIQLPELP